MEKPPSRVSELYFEELGECFDAYICNYESNRRIQLILEMLPQNASSSRALEIGCGTGRISEAILPAVGSLTVLDLSRKLAESLGDRLGTDWLQGDVCNLCRIENAQYDIVVSSEVIEHTPYPKRALKEMCRILAPGGHLIVTSPNKLWFFLLKIATKLELRKFRGNEIWLSPREAGDVIQSEGLKKLQFGGCNLLPWQIPGMKTVLPFFDQFHRKLYPLMINYGIRAQKQL